VVVDGDIVPSVPGCGYKHVGLLFFTFKEKVIRTRVLSVLSLFFLGIKVVIDGSPLETNFGNLIIDPSPVEKLLRTSRGCFYFFSQKIPIMIMSWNSIYF